MSDDKFQHKYRIESARASWHDYDGGSYFITICTKDREHYFGEIVDGGMVLSDIGKYAALSLCGNSIVDDNAESFACNCHHFSR